MIELQNFKDKRLNELRNRLREINEIVGLETDLKLQDREDSFATKIKEKNLELMRKYYKEVISIEQEISKLEGIKSFFSDKD
ncbi:hypothetical protein [Hungatella hathewayi]|uniref:hypothetical protein n=1 Tax=Hungatella hathewayi TaxID=154046 RepID=UPI003567C2C8